MVGAMYEQRPEFFMKFRIKFRYQICLEEPRGSGGYFGNKICYAFHLHSEESEYCDIEQKHYHLLLESSSKFQKRGREYAVPCLNSTFSSLIPTTSYLKLNGYTIEKFNPTASNNKNPHNGSPFSRNMKPICKRVPIVRK